MFLFGVWNRRSIEIFIYEHTYKQIFINKNTEKSNFKKSKMHGPNLILAVFTITSLLTPYSGWASETADVGEVKNDGEIKVYKRLIPADVLRGKLKLSLLIRLV